MRFDPNDYKPLSTIHLGTAAAYVAVVAFMIYCAVQMLQYW